MNLNSKAPIITIDLEDWFHLLECDAIPGVEHWPTLESRVEANTDRLLGLLDKHDVKATFFTLGWVANHYPTLLQRVAKAGHQIGCHSDVHTLVHQQTEHAFRVETRQAISAISDAISSPVLCYRAPGFSITDTCLWAFGVLSELGIQVDSSVFPGNHAHGGTGAVFPAVPFRIEHGGSPLCEFPISLSRFGPFQVAVAGGGYFRILPFSLIAHWIAGTPYNMTYFHPRDFDADQPRIQGLSSFRTFKAYTGLNNSFAKLDRFLIRFGGQSVESAHATTDWASAPVVRF